MYQPAVSNLSFPHFPNLRAMCDKRLSDEGRVAWTEAEKRAIRMVVADYTKRHPKARGEWTSNPGILEIGRDVDSPATERPKWEALSLWLSVDGAASSIPELVATLARLAIEDHLSYPPTLPS